MADVLAEAEAHEHWTVLRMLQARAVHCAASQPVASAAAATAAGVGAASSTTGLPTVQRCSTDTLQQPSSLLAPPAAFSPLDPHPPCPLSLPTLPQDAAAAEAAAAAAKAATGLTPGGSGIGRGWRSRGQGGGRRRPASEDSGVRCVWVCLLAGMTPLCAASPQPDR